MAFNVAGVTSVELLHPEPLLTAPHMIYLLVPIYSLLLARAKSKHHKKDSLFQHKQPDWFHAASKINKQLNTLKNCCRDVLKEDQRLISLLQRMLKKKIL